MPARLWLKDSNNPPHAVTVGCVLFSLVRFLYLCSKKENIMIPLKMLYALVGAFPLTIGVEFLKYVYQDWEFAKWIFVAITIDTIVSLVKHWLMKNISSEEFWHKFAKKIFIYIMLLILSNVLANFTVGGRIVGPTQWVGDYLCVYMIVREAISIVENANAIMPVVPAWLLRRLKDFDEKGKYVGEGRVDDYDREQNVED